VYIVNAMKITLSLLEPLYNIIAWLCPLLVIVPLTALTKLGYAPYAAANWCFVEDPKNCTSNVTSNGLHWKTITFIFVAGKLWEILTYIGVILIYTHIAVHLSRVPSYHILSFTDVYIAGNEDIVHCVHS